jgi:hypothetical protein
MTRIVKDFCPVTDSMNVPSPEPTPVGGPEVPDTSTVEVTRTKFPLNMKVALIAWAIGAVVFVGSEIWAGALQKTDQYAALYFFVFPLYTAIIWFPLGVVSIVFSAISLARREGQKGLAIGLIVVAAILPGLTYGIVPLASAPQY